MYPPLGVSAKWKRFFVHQNFSPAAIQSINTPGAMLLITEGEKKALAATQDGFPAIGLPGVKIGQKKRETDKSGNKIGERELHDDFNFIDRKNRTVIIVFDSDETHNPDVEREAAKLAHALTICGANVHIRTVPILKVNRNRYIKTGIDDFLVRTTPNGSKKFAQSSRLTVNQR